MTIHFHDVSHHQGDYHPTGPLIAKATQGATFVDERYTTNRDRTVAGGWPFAGFHFLVASAIAPIPAQIEHALAVIGTDTPMMADVEVLKVAGRPDTWPTFDEALAWYRGILDGGGRLRLDYIPEWFWAGHWGGRSMAPFAELGIHLISSDYPPEGYTAAGPGWALYGGRTPAIWQWTSTPVDTNAYRGSVEQLRTLFEGTDAAVTEAEMQALITKLLGTTLGTSGPTVGVALQRAAGVPAEIAALGTPATIAAAVVAALPPAAAAGGATPDQVAQAVHDALTKLQLALAP